MNQIPRKFQNSKLKSEEIPKPKNQILRKCDFARFDFVYSDFLGIWFLEFEI